MAFRRDRNIRDVYEERFPAERGGPYSRGGQGDRRLPFGRPDDDYGRGFDYDGPGFYPNGAPRNHHNEEQRGYQGDSHHSFPGDLRGGPPGRRQEDFSYYRGPRDEPHGGRQMDFRPTNRTGPPLHARSQGPYHPARSVSTTGPDPEDNFIQVIRCLQKGDDPNKTRKKGPFPPIRDRSPARRDIPPSPHSRSGSSVSSRSYSPERSKVLPFSAQQGKNRERPPGPSVSASRDGSPHSTASKEDIIPPVEVPIEEVPAAVDETSSVMDDFQERRAQAIAAKAREIEKVYRQDCETFGMVVKMLVAKDASLEKHLQSPLKDNLIEIRERCLEDLKNFIAELDEVVRQPEPTV